MKLRPKHLLLYTLIAISTLACKEPVAPIHNPSCDQYHDMEVSFIHSVFFWMKEDATQEDKDAMVKAMEGLSKVESISRVYFGPPANTEERDVVDNTYAYAFIVHFKDKAAHDAYQVDPIHLDFIEKNKHYWTKVKVYDNDIQARY